MRRLPRRIRGKAKEPQSSATYKEPCACRQASDTTHPPPTVLPYAPHSVAQSQHLSQQYGCLTSHMHTIKSCAESVKHAHQIDDQPAFAKNQSPMQATLHPGHHPGQQLRCRRNLTQKLLPSTVRPQAVCYWHSPCTQHTHFQPHRRAIREVHPGYGRLHPGSSTVRPQAVCSWHSCQTPHTLTSHISKQNLGAASVANYNQVLTPTPAKRLVAARTATAREASLPADTLLGVPRLNKGLGIDLLRINLCANLAAKPIRDCCCALLHKHHASVGECIQIQTKAQRSGGILVLLCACQRCIKYLRKTLGCSTSNTICI